MAFSCPLVNTPSNNSQVLLNPFCSLKQTCQDSLPQHSHLPVGKISSLKMVCMDIWISWEGESLLSISREDLQQRWFGTFSLDDFSREKVLLAALKSLTRRMFLVLAHGASLAADELPEGWWERSSVWAARPGLVLPLQVLSSMRPAACRALTGKLFCKVLFVGKSLLFLSSFIAQFRTCKFFFYFSVPRGWTCIFWPAQMVYFSV